MSVEEELKKDHSDMQAVVDSKQKIIDAQVTTQTEHSLPLCQYFPSVCAVTCVFLAETKGSLEYKEMFNS